MRARDRVPPGGWSRGGGGPPVQIVLGGTDYAELVAVARQADAAHAGEPGPRPTSQSDYEERKPQLRVAVDRDRAADLGVSLQTVGRTLETMLGSRIVTTFIDRDREYNVILQGRAEDRATPHRPRQPLRALGPHRRADPAVEPRAAHRSTAGPTRLNRFNRLRSITISAALAPGYTLGEALDYVEKVVKRRAAAVPARSTTTASRASSSESGGQLYFTFLLALVIVFLVLAAQFESFVHPLVIMATVPLAVTGALFGLWLFGMSINIFSQIAAIMLIGLAAKNGILIVEFANQLRDRGVEFVEAVIEAAAIRLRPVLMTSFCTAFGALPLMLATGAGAEAAPVDRRRGVLRRRDLGRADAVRRAGGVRADRAQYPLAPDRREDARQAACSGRRDHAIERPGDAWPSSQSGRPTYASCC